MYNIDNAGDLMNLCYPLIKGFVQKIGVSYLYDRFKVTNYGFFFLKKVEASLKYIYHNCGVIETVIQGNWFTDIDQLGKK